MPSAIIVSAIGLACYVGLIVVIVFPRRPGRTNQAFLLFLAAMTIWQFTALMVSLSQDAVWALRWYRLMVVGLVGQFVFYLFFTQAFLGRSRPRAIAWAGWAALLTLLSVSGTGLIIEDVSRSDTGLFIPKFGVLVPVVAACVLSCLGYGVYTLVNGYRQTNDALQRNRIKYLLLGVGVIALGSFTNLAPTLQSQPVDVAANVVNALLTTYAIRRYRLLDISLVLRKGLLYSGLTAVIGAGYFLLISAVVGVLHLVSERQIMLTSIIVAAVAAVAVLPLRDWMQAWIDRLFFRERHDSSLMLQRLSGAAASILNLDQLTHMILEEVSSTIHIQRSAFFLRLQPTGEFRLVAQRGLEASGDLVLRPDHPVVRWLSVHDRALSRQDLEFQPQFKALWGQEKHNLERMEAELLIPLTVKRQLVGIFAVGPKASEDTYSEDDQNILIALANQTAVAVQNARLYDQVQQELAERRRAEQALRESMEHYQAVSELISEFGYAVRVNSGQDTRLEWITGAFTRITGYSLNDINDGGWATLVHPDDLPAFIQRAQALVNGQPDIGEFRIITKTGDLRWLGSYAQPIYDQVLRRVDRVYGVAQDITERKQAEQALQAAAADLARSNRELQQFAYVASHDLQEPLRMVSSYLQLLHQRYAGRLGVDADEFIAFAVDGAKRMQALIDDLLAYSRVGTRGTPFQRVDCALVLDRVLADLKVAVQEGGATIYREPLPAVWGDEVQLGQLFQNLIANALKFRSQRCPEVRVGVNRQNEHWLFRVEDNGVGIEPEYWERIFLIFQRLHTREEYPGTGVGLAICKRIVERHGGQIWLESKPDEGTTFYFTVPAIVEAAI